MAVKFSTGHTLVDTQEPAKIQTPVNVKTTDLFRGYPANIFQRMLDHICDGDTLAKACNRKGMPSEKTVRKRLQINADMQHRYEVANNIRMDSLLDKTVQIADTALDGCKTISAADRLRHADLKIRTIHAALEKGNPGRYGKGQGGEGGTVIVHNSLDVENAQSVNAGVGVTFKGGSNA